MRRRESLEEGWQIVRSWLPDDLNESAKRTGLWKRSEGLQDAECWLRLILMHVAGGLSLEQTVVRARELGWLRISAVALFKRLKRARSWLEELTSYLLAAQRRRLGQWKCPFGYRLRVIDATDIQEPGSTGTDLRLHYSIRMPELVCDYCEVTDVHGGESLSRFEFSPGQLIWVDCGYCRAPGVSRVLESGAALLVRWHPKSFPMECVGGHPLNLLERLRRLPNQTVEEWKVQFVYQRKVYYLRLCARRKDPAAAQEARCRVLEKAKTDGRQASPEALELAEYILVLTSLPAEFSRFQVLQLYRCRWQIELVFKRLKSLLAAGHVPKNSDESGLAWMQAKILCALLLERVLLEGHFFPSSDSRFDEVSRWRVVVEVRDSLQQVLAPPLPLPHLLRRGRAIALSLRVRRPKRPLQLTKLRQIFRRRVRKN